MKKKLAFRKLLGRCSWLAFAVLLFCARSQAATCPIASGASQSTIASTITGCASGNTVTFAAGSYTMTASVTVPCGVSISGPTVPIGSYTGIDGFKRLGYTPTAAVIWAGGNHTQAFIYNSCSTARVFQYMECNMGQPSPDGGQCIVGSSGGGISDLTIQYDYFHGNQGGVSSTSEQDSLVEFSGSTGSTYDDSDTVQWNRFGATGDCSNIMQNYTYAGFSGNGGFCSGLSEHTNMSTYLVQYNDFQMEENESKFYESSGGCINCVWQYNDFSEWHRIAMENQSNSGASFPTNQEWQYNSVHDAYFPGVPTFGWSIANGCFNGATPPNPSNCISNADYNVIMANSPLMGQSRYADAIEWFGSRSHINYNLLEGFANSIMVGVDGSLSANNNTIYNTSGGTCTVGSSSGGYFNTEEGPEALSLASGTGNSCNSGSNSAAVTSVAPTISPASGAFSGPHTVTFTNGASAVNRDANTGIWYTTDGSSPVPGAGTAQYIASGGTISTSSATVKAAGMWGAANQPASYASGWGYVPSAVVSATFTNNDCTGPGGSVLITTYGGAVGDGTTDNTTAIQNTFNYAKTNACPVEIPAGTFAYSNVLAINGITVFGLGSSSILKATNANDQAVELEGASPSLSSVVINGTGSSRLTSYQASGVWVFNATNYTINNVLVNGAACVGIYNDGGTNGTETNNTVENTLADSITNTNSATVAASHVLIQNNLVYNSGDDGVSNNSYVADPSGETVNNITVNANAIMRNFFARGLEVSGGANISFTNNYVDNKSGYACMALLSESGSFNTQTVNTVTATGNTLLNCGPNQGSLFVWAEGSGNLVENVLFNGNRFNAETQQTFTAVQVEGSGSITGSTVENSSAYIGSVGFLANQCSPTSNCNITQTGNVTSAVSSYPGPLSAPIGGTVPIFSLPTGTYTLPQSLTLNEVTASDTIDYCTVSSGTCTPTTAYSSAITVSAPETVCAVGINNSVSGSPVTSAPVCATYNGGTAITLESGSQTNTGSVNTLTVGQAAVQQIAVGLYSDSSSHNLPFGGQIASWSSSNTDILNVTSAGLVSCLAPGSANSQVTAEVQGTVFSPWGWTCIPETAAATPTFSPSTETFSGSVSVTISDATSGATIYFTTDGSTPTTSSSVFSAPITITSTTTVNAIATASGFSQSAVGTATYTNPSSFFISPTGSDSNPGTSASPWLTPNHALACGNTITASAGSYSNASFGPGNWGTVTCAAANNVAWLQCATFDACKINVPSGSSNPGMYVDQPYWGVQGWEVTVSAAPANNGECFLAQPSSFHSVTVHHVIFANNVANGCYYGGFIANSYSSTASVDYFNVIGNIAFNAAQGSSECFSGISVFQPIASDANTGTHIYVAGNVSYGNLDPSTCDGTAPTDGEGATFDTFDNSFNAGAPVYQQQAAMENNLFMGNGGPGIVIDNNNVSVGAPIFVEHNTTFGNMQSPTREFCGGQAEIGVTTAFNVTSTENLTMTSGATAPCGDSVFGFSMNDGNSTDVVSGNWLYSASGNNTFLSGSGSFAYGSNTTGTSPGFAGTTIPGAPSCSGTANTVACMASAITEFTPSTSGASVFGYQPPSSTPIADALFPQWLCGVTLPSGIVTSGCAAAPTLTGGFQGNVGSINTLNVGAPPIQQEVFGEYSSGTSPIQFNETTNMDPYGNTVVWGSSNTAILTVSSTGLISCVGTGSANSEITNFPSSFAVWGWTCNAAPPSTAGQQIGVYLLGP